MMNNTYSLVISQSERAWSFQWARTLFALERRLSDEEKLFYLKKYAINLSTKTAKSSTADKADAAVEIKSNGGGSLSAQTLADEQQQQQRAALESGEQFVPGLMIIKQTDRTKAELRRRLIGLWQVSVGAPLDQRACVSKHDAKLAD
jgi:hypothetical protein